MSPAADTSSTHINVAPFDTGYPRVTYEVAGQRFMSLGVSLNTRSVTRLREWAPEISGQRQERPWEPIRTDQSVYVAERLPSDPGVLARSAVTWLRALTLVRRALHAVRSTGVTWRRLLTAPWETLEATLIPGANIACVELVGWAKKHALTAPGLSQDLPDRLRCLMEMQAEEADNVEPSPPGLRALLTFLVRSGFGEPEVTLSPHGGWIAEWRGRRQQLVVEFQAEGRARFVLIQRRRSRPETRVAGTVDQRELVERLGRLGVVQS